MDYLYNNGTEKKYDDFLQVLRNSYKDVPVHEEVMEKLG